MVLINNKIIININATITTQFSFLERDFFVVVVVVFLITSLMIIIILNSIVILYSSTCINFDSQTCTALTRVVAWMSTDPSRMSVVCLSSKIEE